MPRLVIRRLSACRAAAQTQRAQARVAARADNYVEDVLGGFQFEKSKPYLLYRNKKDEARPSTRMCTSLANVQRKQLCSPLLSTGDLCRAELQQGFAIW